MELEGFEAEVPSRSAHVSLGYTLCEESEEKLERLMRQVANERIELGVIGLEVLEGMTTPFDYIALTLEESHEFRVAKQAVEGELPVKRFPGGFKVHVTLLQVPKGCFSAEQLEEWRDRLLEAARPYCGCTTVCGEKLAVFDQEKRCRIECRLPQVA